MTHTRDQFAIIHGLDEHEALPQIQWALEYLTKVLEKKSIHVCMADSLEDADAAMETVPLQIRLGLGDGKVTASMPHDTMTLPPEKESFVIASRKQEGKCQLTLTGRDIRGLMYAMLELADIALHAEDPLAALSETPSNAVRPANTVRSITRLFTSEPEDKPWFYDRNFWEEYLTELAIHRFNRLTFSVGTGYDYLIDRVVLDPYFCFFYPFVLAVPGYEVQVAGLSDTERERNLDMLRFISSAAARRGIDFRLGLWNQAYDYGPNNTHPGYRINGLNESNHAAYCRDALALLLKSCPEIKGLTFRVHFEGGIPEPTHEFWRVALARVSEVDSLEEIDFHAKGVGTELIDIAGGTGKRVVLSTKGWAEHMGPPYHQASIRLREFARKSASTGAISFHPPSTGHHEARNRGMENTSKRSYTRYSYADFLRDDRPYDVIHRVWPGTQRILLWGDPAMAASIGSQYAGFQGSLGVEWFDPLSFKGKKGSGSLGERELYKDESLKLGLRDWTKFRYTYRLWGRLAYNPEASSAEWRRYLQSTYQDAAASCESALAAATKILPFVTLVHAPSVANNVYWPEMYTNIPLVRGDEKPENPYAPFGWPVNADFDMEAPYNFMNASPLDPALVYRINEFAADMLAGHRRGKLAPHEIAERLERLADRALQELEAAEKAAGNQPSPEFRRLSVDVRIMAGIGRFFAHKFRAGLAYALHSHVGGGMLADALAHYKKARHAWQEIADVSEDVYKDDITFGHTPYSRGHWRDRLVAIDEDIAAVEQLAAAQPGTADGTPTSTGLHAWLAARAGGERPVCTHRPSAAYVKGQPMEIQVELQTQEHADPAILLHVRHVNQAEEYEEIPMVRDEGKSAFRAVIPAAYTESPYGLQYFFELTTGDGDAWLSPGLDDTLSGQPYHVLNAQQ